MTNGEKILSTFSNLITNTSVYAYCTYIEVVQNNVFVAQFNMKWWNAECQDEEIDKSLSEDELVEIRTLRPGTTIKLGSIKMEILDSTYTGEDDEPGVLCMVKDILFKKSFDEGNYNNWKVSSLREYLNGEYKDSLDAELTSALIPFERSLLADDGMKKYGKCTDLISLISEREYQDYRECISNKSDWWWTLTAYSTDSDKSYRVMFVFTGGNLDNCGAFYGDYGILPLFLIKEDTLVKVIYDMVESKE